MRHLSVAKESSDLSLIPQPYPYPWVKISLIFLPEKQTHSLETHSHSLLCLGKQTHSLGSHSHSLLEDEEESKEEEEEGKKEREEKKYQILLHDVFILLLILYYTFIMEAHKIYTQDSTDSFIILLELLSQDIVILEKVKCVLI